MLTPSLFHDEIEALAPQAFLAHFLVQRPAWMPIPPATPTQLDNARQILEDQFTLVGETYRLAPGFSWKQNPSQDKEWQIAQHKFYFAIDLIQAFCQSGEPAYLERWVALLSSWLDEMGSGFISASDAQVEAKRIEHWVTALQLLHGCDTHGLVTASFLRRLLERIINETDYICQHLKPVRNHRTFQLFTIFLVGVSFPEAWAAAGFVELGRIELTRNLLTDFLPDGVHVELSTHYHQLVLETGLAFVTLAEAHGITLDPALYARLARACSFSMHMQWPDGSIPLINDSDDGDHREMLCQGSRLFRDPHLLWAASLGQQGVPPTASIQHYPDSGYLIFSDGWGHDPASYPCRQHVFYDCALLGEGSHSHYDLFSFCYYANGQALIIDPGRYTYSAEPDADGIDWRQQFKSTAYHNTITIDQQDQTRYISKARRSTLPGAHAPTTKRKHGPDVQIEAKQVSLELPAPWVSAKARSAEYTPIHQRLFVYPYQQYLLLFDQVAITDAMQHECVLRFHLPEHARDRVVLAYGEQMVTAHAPHVRIHSPILPGITAQVEQSWVSRAYGIKQPAPVLALRQVANHSISFCSVIAPTRVQGQAFEITAVQLCEEPTHQRATIHVHGIAAGMAFHDHVQMTDGCNREVIVFRNREMRHDNDK